MCDSLEHDALQLYVEKQFSLPTPSAKTGAIDAAIQAFAISMPFQSAKVQYGALEQILSVLAPSFNQQTTARDLALYVNVSCALLQALHVSNKASTSVSISKSSDVERSFQELFHVRLADFILASH